MVACSKSVEVCSRSDDVCLLAVVVCLLAVVVCSAVEGLAFRSRCLPNVEFVYALSIGDDQLIVRDVYMAELSSCIPQENNTSSSSL